MLRSLTITAISAALLAASAAPALAQNAGNWSFELGAGTDNRSKGVSKSDGEPYAWATAEWESESGLFYVAPGAQTIKSGGSDLELEVEAGVRPEWAGFDFNLSAARKWRVDTNPGYDADTWELTADMKRSIGPASGRLRVQYSPDGVGSTKEWTWVAVRGGWEFTPRLTGTAEIGRREQNGSLDYTAYNVGFAYDLTQNLQADLRWYGTDAEVPGEQYSDSLVATVAVAF